MIRILLVEDNKVVRDLMAKLLENEDEMTVAGIAEDGRQH